MHQQLTLKKFVVHQINGAVVQVVRLVQVVRSSESRRP